MKISFLKFCRIFKVPWMLPMKHEVGLGVGGMGKGAGDGGGWPGQGHRRFQSQCAPKNILGIVQQLVKMKTLRNFADHRILPLWRGGVQRRRRQFKGPRGTEWNGSLGSWSRSTPHCRPISGPISVPFLPPSRPSNPPSQPTSHPPSSLSTLSTSMGPLNDCEQQRAASLTGE